MKKILIIILCIIFLFGCTSNKVVKKYKATYKVINLTETKKLLKKGNTVLIDVRSEDEYNKKHLSKAINIYYDDIDTIIDEISKDSVVIIYAKTNKISKKTVNKVIDLGYSLVYDLGSYDDIK